MKLFIKVMILLILLTLDSGLMLILVPLIPNIPAVDTTLDLGYCWTSWDSTWEGNIPVAVGYTLLYGPIIPEMGLLLSTKVN